MTEQATPAPAAPTSPSTSTESPEVIVRSEGGSINLNEFKNISGLNKVVEDSDDDNDADIGEDSDNTLETGGNDDPEVETPDETDSEGDTEDGLEAEQGEVSEAALKKLEVKGKGIAIKTADGQLIKLAPDTVIVHKVDGVPTEINLQQAINREVGELTVEQRLSRVANVEHTLKTKLAHVEKREAEDGEFINKVASLAASDKPELAFAELGERLGFTPGHMYKVLMKKGLEWAKIIQLKGLKPADIEAYCTKVDRDYLANKIEEDKKKSVHSRETETLQEIAAQEVPKYKLTDEEFDEATSELLGENGAFDGLSPEKKISKVINRALQNKHSSMIQEAVKGTPFEKDEKVIGALFRATDPVDWSIEEIREIAVASVQKSVATKLPASPSVTGTAKPQNVGAKTKQEKVVVKRPGDFRRAYGL